MRWKRKESEKVCARDRECARERVCERERERECERVCEREIGEIEEE